MCYITKINLTIVTFDDAFLRIQEKIIQNLWSPVSVSEFSSKGKSLRTCDQFLFHRKNFEMLISLHCRSLDWGRKLKYSEETPEAQGEYATGQRQETTPNLRGAVNSD